MSRQFSEEYLLSPAFSENSELREFLNSVRACYGSKTPAKTAFLDLDGKIYIAAGNVVQPFENEDKPEFDDILYEGSILVFFRPINQTMVDHIAVNFLFRDLHLHKPGPGEKTRSVMLPLSSPSGRDVIHFGWYPEWPSRTILTYVISPLLLLVIAILVLVRYATRALRRSTNEIIRSRDEAVAAERSKTSLLANVSHEFRTPLNGIIGFSELMGAGDLPNGKIQQYAAIINESGNHLLTVIEDVLSMAQLEMGVLTLHEAEFDLCECVRASLRLQGLRANRDNTDLDLIRKSDRFVVRGDEAKLRQVIINLVANAVKFSPNGGRVTVEIDDAGDTLEIRVRDQGIGISTDDIAKVLRPFGQVENSLTRQYEGTGLGLPISKSLVELHGGALTIESELGVGTTVTVTLPADRIVRAPQRNRAASAKDSQDTVSAA